MYRMTYAFVTPFCNPHLPEENSPRQQHLRKGRIVAQCDTFSLKTRDDGELYLASDPWLLHIDAEELKTGELAVDISAIPLEVVPPRHRRRGRPVRRGKRPPPSCCGH